MSIDRLIGDIVGMGWSEPETQRLPDDTWLAKALPGKYKLPSITTCGNTWMEAIEALHRETARWDRRFS